MDTLEVEVVVATAYGKAAAIGDLAPAVANGADRTVKTVECIISTYENISGV